MIQHQRPLAMSDPGDAATSRGLASIGGADVQTLPDDHPVAIILADGEYPPATNGDDAA